MTALRGSFGSISPDAVPSSCSYWPTVPKDIPPNAGDVFAVITMFVIRASAVAAVPNIDKAPTAMALVECKQAARFLMILPRLIIPARNVRERRVEHRTVLFEGSCTAFCAALICGARICFLTKL